MFIVSRLTSRGSVALSVSIGYARLGGGRGAALRARSPDDDDYRLGAGLIHVHAHPVQKLTGISVRFFQYFQAVFSDVFLAAYCGTRGSNSVLRRAAPGP